MNITIKILVIVFLDFIVPKIIWFILSRSIDQIHDGSSENIFSHYFYYLILKNDSSENISCKKIKESWRYYIFLVRLVVYTVDLRTVNTGLLKYVLSVNQKTFTKINMAVQSSLGQLVCDKTGR